MGVLWRRSGFNVFVPLGNHFLCTSVSRGVRPEHRCHGARARCGRADAPTLLCDHPFSHVLGFDGSPRSAVRFVEVSLAFHVAGDCDPNTYEWSDANAIASKISHDEFDARRPGTITIRIYE